MLFDPSAADNSVSAGPHAWQSRRAAAARCGSAADLLTLPDVSREVPASAFLKWREAAQTTSLIDRQFRHGPLRAHDVKNPASAADAFQQAFFAWCRRQAPDGFTRLTWKPVLFDAGAVHDYTSHCDSSLTSEDDPCPLFFGVEVPDDWVYQLAPAVPQLRAAHPDLLRTVMAAIAVAGARTTWIRAPDWFMYEFSCWHWDGDESITDEDAAELMEERFDNQEVLKRFLPSAVRPVLEPDDFRPQFKVVRGRVRHDGGLSPDSLRALRPRLRGLPRRVCTALLELRALTSSHRKRDLFHLKYLTNPVYAACTLVHQWNEWTEEMLDSHYDSASSSGDGTTYVGFSPLAVTSKAIRTQYADLSLAIQILKCLDKLLSLVSESI